LDGGVDVHKKRKRYDDGLQELDEKLRDLPSTVYNTEVGALVITVSDMAYDAVENLDPTKFEQNKMTNYLNLIQGIYHKIGTVPAPKHDGDHNDKALWRKAPTDDGGDSGPWLFWTNSGWVFSTSLNMSMQMSYDEAGTLAWGSVSDDMPWPMDVHVPYWCDTSFKELTKKNKKKQKKQTNKTTKTLKGAHRLRRCHHDPAVHRLGRRSAQVHAIPIDRSPAKHEPRHKP